MNYTTKTYEYYIVHVGADCIDNANDNEMNENGSVISNILNDLNSVGEELEN